MTGGRSFKKSFARTCSSCDLASARLRLVGQRRRGRPQWAGTRAPPPLLSPASTRQGRPSYLARVRAGLLTMLRWLELGDLLLGARLVGMWLQVSCRLDAQGCRPATI